MMTSESDSYWNDPTVMSLLFPIKNGPNYLAMKLHHWKLIEDYVPTTSECPDPPKYVKLDYDWHTGTTPLIVACQLGKLDAVKRLVEFWGVDVRASAKYFFNLNLTTKPHHVIESATPLFVAAHHGQLQIVRYLLEKGADVSAKTSNQDFLEYDGLTALYGAVWNSPSINLLEVASVGQLRRERSAIVRCLLESDPNLVADSSSSSSGRPIWLNKLCGADSIIELVNHGLDLKLRNPSTGETLLHNVGALFPSYFVGEDSLVIVKLLVYKGADLLARDNLGFTPILRAANFTYKRPNFAILDHLLELDGISRMEKIDALELAGATILYRPKNASHFPKSFDYWRRAHHLREMEKEATGSSAEKSLGPKKEGTMEWATLAQLEHAIQHPEDYNIQSLLVRLRILSGRSWKAVCPVLDLCVTRLGETITFVERVDILLAMLNTICRFHPREIDKRFQRLTVCFVNKLVGELVCEAWSILTNDQQYATFFFFNMFENSLHLILLAINRLQPDHFYKISIPRLFELFVTMFHLPGMLQEDRNRDSTIQLLRDHVTSNRLGLILTNAYVCHWNAYLNIVLLLLEAGADPNAGLDGAGNAPLHLVAGLNDQELGEAAAILLVDSGAHVDRVNKAGQTATDIWIETRNRYGAETGWNVLPDWCRAVPNLLCLAARVIRERKIPYTDGKTPATLHPFIAMH